MSGLNVKSYFWPNRLSLPTVGWGDNPPPEARPVSPPVYTFDIDSKVFCGLVEVCLSFNQFNADGRFYRMIKGFFIKGETRCGVWL